LIRDGTGQFLRGFDDVFRSDDITIIRTPPHTQVANAYAERWVGTARRELCDRTLIWSRRHLEQNAARICRALQLAPTASQSLSTRAQRSRSRRVSARPADPTTPNLQRTHQPVPPSSLTHQQPPTQHQRGQLRRAHSPTTQPETRRRSRNSPVRTSFRHPQVPELRGSIKRGI
jgi:hypothetical protein